MAHVFVKVGEINNLSDARYCAGMGVQLLGFVMKHPARKSLTKEDYIAITHWLEGPKFVGEFIGATNEEILHLHKELNFDYVQTKDPEQATYLINNGIEVIFTVSENVLDIPKKISFLVIEDGFDENTLTPNIDTKLLIGKDVSLESLQHLVNQSKYTGLHLKGSDEIRPGYKNFDELAEILEALEDLG